MSIATALLVAWSVAIFGLILFSEIELRQTFYSFTKARQYNKKIFDSQDDSVKIIIFEDHPSYYRWYEGEIKEWLERSWDKWNNTQPDWYTNKVADSIPLDLIIGGGVEGWKSEAQNTTIHTIKGRTLDNSSRRSKILAKRSKVSKTNATRGSEKYSVKEKKRRGSEMGSVYEMGKALFESSNR
ncbi:hypothetical protein ScalyP_jg9287 [Parmales sp. scaly parma]|nr:hypothetical protein ScalyP_jg9287 [Parmales sp. scaly parma]